MLQWQRLWVLVLVSHVANGKLDPKLESQEDGESGDADRWLAKDPVDVNRTADGNGDDGPDDDYDRSGEFEDSTEHIGAAVTQITRHPYAASLLKNDTYICSAVILNTFWLITKSKCFEPETTTSYVTHRNLKNYTLRVGSSYNNKGGTLYKIMTLINNFDLKVTALKLTSPLEFGARVNAARLPGYDDEVRLGYLASIIAWTPDGHMRLVNAPVIEASICDAYTKLLPGHYICIGGVQDLNRHFCRKDNGGAVIQNNTLIGISSYLHTCALYTRTHAFPKTSSFARWLDSVIWDEDNRPTTPLPTTAAVVSNLVNTTKKKLQDEETRSPYGDSSQFMLTLPFDPINVPLEPSQDNSVLPRMSLYESYLQNMARAKTSKTSTTPSDVFETQTNRLAMEWMKRKYGDALMLSGRFQGKAFENFNDYNS